jgi:hypothetical protein
MTVPHGNIRWRKSTRSGDQGDCVELGHTGAVRDSKNPAGPSLPVQLATLVRAAKAGMLDS